MYRPVKQRRVSGCLQAMFCKSSDMATCLEQIFARATELHDGEITILWHDLQVTARQRNHSNVTANNAHEYFQRVYFLPFIDSVLYR